MQRLVVVGCTLSDYAQTVARLRRIVIPGLLHLVVQSGRGGEPVFADDLDRARYLEGLKDAARDAQVAVHAYGLPDDEVRLLVTPASATGLSAMVQAVGRRYVRLLNQRHGRHGTPWNGRFRSSIIDPGAHFLDAMYFVELSPSNGEAAVASTVSSSLSHHLGVATQPLITEHPAYWTIGNTPFDREQAYRRYIDSRPVSDDAAGLLRAALNGWALGAPAFAQEIEARAGRRMTKQPRGRPRKPQLD